MRIVIDMQGAQSESRFRGIGRYTMDFAQAVVRNRGNHEIFLVLNGMLSSSVECIRAAFDGLLPQENIYVWYAPTPVCSAFEGNNNRREIAELMREAFIASLQPDIVHIPSLFEGYLDDSVTSIGRFDKTTPVSVTLLDLIPLLSPDQYLKNNPNFSSYYYRKLESLEKAIGLLAISESAKEEAISHLKFTSTDVVNTYLGVGDNFRHISISAEEQKHFLSTHKISKPFVLYTGGADERKNLPRLIEAYSQLDSCIRKLHCLVFAGKFPDSENVRLKDLAKKFGLQEEEFILTGYVDENTLVKLYNLCKLYVFTSWHEGFGLPVLEAMACGAPVIGSNTTSLPEVIGLESALFDPYSVASISEKMRQALTNDEFYQCLCIHAELQFKKFSWDKTAQISISAWEKLASNRTEYLGKRWAPAQEHVSLIHELSLFLEQRNNALNIEVAMCLARNEGGAVQRQLFLDISELCQHDSATGVQRVVRSYLYHLLVSPPAGFHVRPVFASQTQGYQYANQYTSRLLNQDYMETQDTPIHWQRGDVFFGLDMQHHVQLAHFSLFDRLREDGVTVKFLVHDLLPIQLANLFKDNNAKELHEQWLSMIAKQDEAICVSKATADALDDWLKQNSVFKNSNFIINWVHNGADLDGSKPSVGLADNATEILEILNSRPTFLVVSTLEPRKGQEQILNAIELIWSEGIDVNLTFVGSQGWKVDELAERIARHHENGKRLFWLKGISDEYLQKIYRASTCLIAASINEGFGLSLIEAANYGVPVIARDIPVFREVAGDAAFYFQGISGEDLAESIKKWINLNENGIAPASDAMTWNTWQQSTEQLKSILVEQNYSRKQLLVDISELVQRDAKTGIQRVVREILKNWLAHPPSGYQVLPVYATPDALGYRYAHNFLNHQFLDLPIIKDVEDTIVDVWQGDMFVGLDLQHVAQYEVLQDWRNRGVNIWFVVYDLLPVLLPQYFPPEAKICHQKWLKLISEFDGVACISESVASEYKQWLQNQGQAKRLRPIKIKSFPLGVDKQSSINTKGIPDDGYAVLNTISSSNSFLIVGTIEPRKGHAQVLDAFEQLWAEGGDQTLVIVGKKGWMVDSLIERLENHIQLGKFLFLISNCSDDYLGKIYENSKCLIAASYGEGFGLPLIEAAKHHLPIIARDIPVFREVAGNAAFYFSGETSLSFKDDLNRWIALYDSGREPKINNLKWLDWKESADKLLSIITK